jgi:MFS family permease
MLASVAIPAPAPPRTAIVVGLLGLLVFINYVDRGNLATAGPLVKSEIGLSNTQFGLLVSAFFWTYTPSQLAAGWMAQRFNTYTVLSWGLVIWALATIATGLSSGFAALLALRLILGLGESVAFPCASKLIGEQVPQHQLGHANAHLAAGLSFGPAFGIFAGGMLMAQFGWRMTFLLFGAVSLLWLVPWLAVRRAANRHAAPLPDRSPPWRVLLRCRSAWGAGFGHFSLNYSFYFLLAWLPLYLVKSRGFTLEEMAMIGGAVYLLQGISAFVSGWIADRWISAGATPNRARKTMLVAGTIVTGLCLAVATLGDASLAIAALLVSGISGGMTATNTYAAGQTCAGPQASGKWIGFQNFVGNLAGIVAPALTGFLVDYTGGYGAAFGVAATVSVLGALCWGRVVQRVEPVDWAMLNGR